MKKSFFLLAISLLFMFACSGTYKPECKTPIPGQWAEPENIIPFYDPQWGEGGLVLNTNLKGQFCDGFFTFVSPVSGAVKIVPVPREKGRSILSGIASDTGRGLIFTGERTERELIVVDYKSGRVLVHKAMKLPPVSVYYYDELNFKGDIKKKVVGVLTSGGTGDGRLYLWEEESLLKGGSSFYSTLLDMKYPGGMIKVGDKIFIVPYSTGSLEEILLADGRKKVFTFPYLSLSWEGTWVSYCRNFSSLCISSGSVKRILFFDPTIDNWSGELNIGKKVFNFDSSDGGIYLASYDPPGLFRLERGEEERIADSSGYGFVAVIGDYIYFSDFNGEKVEVFKK